MRLDKRSMKICAMADVCDDRPTAGSQEGNTSFSMGTSLEENESSKRTSTESYFCQRVFIWSRQDSSV